MNGYYVQHNSILNVVVIINLVEVLTKYAYRYTPIIELSNLIHINIVTLGFNSITR